MQNLPKAKLYSVRILKNSIAEQKTNGTGQSGIKSGWTEKLDARSQRPHPQLELKLWPVQSGPQLLFWQLEDEISYGSKIASHACVHRVISWSSICNIMIFNSPRAFVILFWYAVFREAHRQIFGVAFAQPARRSIVQWSAACSHKGTNKDLLLSVAQSTSPEMNNMTV